MTDRPTIAVFSDPLEERWPSMDLVGEMLLREWRSTYAKDVQTIEVRPSIARRCPRVVAEKTAFNVDRILTRFVDYPIRVARMRGAASLFHVVDHTYAQLVHALPRGRAGVFCHDIDAFRSLLPRDAEPRPAWFRAMARATLLGLRRAAVVFHSTVVVREQLLANGLVEADRLVHAPYGVGEDFTPGGDPVEENVARLAPLRGRPFLLHVGSAAPRKRLDVLFDAFARLRARHPDLCLVQQGATLSPELSRRVEDLGIRDALLQPPPLARPALADLYRRAALVLVPSEAEGFGLPVLEALACGAPVVASDIPVLREVGAGAVRYAPVGDAVAWAEILDGILSARAEVPPREQRLARAGEFTWRRHAGTLLEAYLNLLGDRRGLAQGAVVR